MNLIIISVLCTLGVQSSKTNLYCCSRQNALRRRVVQCASESQSNWGSIGGYSNRSFQCQYKWASLLYANHVYWGSWNWERPCNGQFCHTKFCIKCHLFELSKESQWPFLEMAYLLNIALCTQEKYFAYMENWLIYCMFRCQVFKKWGGVQEKLAKSQLEGEVKFAKADVTLAVNICLIFCNFASRMSPFFFPKSLITRHR